MMLKIKKENIIGGLLVFVIALTIYIICLAPTIYLEDSAEFVAAADTLGIPHPSGYPLYVILGKLFSFLPLASLAWRINFMSAFFAALTGVVVFLIIKEFLLENIFLKGKAKVLVAILGSLLFCFSQIFWSQAEIAEVYTLNSFLMAVVFCCLYQWSRVIKIDQNQEKKYFLLTCFIYGLALTNHLMMILFLPIMIAFILIVDQKIEEKRKLLALGVLVFLIGLSVYLFLPIRATMKPAMNWGETNNLGNLIRHITRQDYQDFEPMFWHNLGSKINYLMAFLKNLISQYTWVGIILGLLGILGLWKKKKKFLFLALGFFLMNSLAIIFLRKGLYSILNDHFFCVYYLPAYLIYGLGVVYGGVFLWAKISQAAVTQQFKKFIRIILIGLLFFLPLNNLVNNFATNNFSHFYFLDNYSRTLLNSLAKNAVFIAEDDFNGIDNILFSVAYQKFSQGLRPDVKVISLTGIFEWPGEEILKIYNQADKKEQKYLLVELLWQQYGQERPVYTLFPLAEQTESQLFTRSNGLVHRVYNNIKEAAGAKIEKPVVQVRDEDNYQVRDNYLGLESLADLYYARASYYLEQGFFTISQQLLRQALNLEPIPNPVNTQEYIKHGALWLEYLKK